MKKLLPIAIAIATLSLTGCTDYREVPVGKVGKVISDEGVQPELLQPGNYNIGYAMKYTKSLALLDTSVETIPVTLAIRMADNQTLTVTTLIKTQLNTKLDKSGNSPVLDSMFGMITPDKAGANTLNIPLTKVYDKLGKDLVQRSMVDVISSNTLETFQKNRAAINDKVEQLIGKQFTKTPLVLLSATFTNIGYPQSYINRADELKSMEMSVELKKNEEEARRAKLMEEEKSIVIDQRVRLAKAETIRLENLATSKGLNPMLLEYRKLDLEERRLDVDMEMAKAAAKNGNATIFYPLHQKPDYAETKLSKK